MSKGKFGIHGGQFVPETLMNAVNEFEEAYEKYKNDPEFVAELDTLMREYAGIAAEVLPAALQLAVHRLQRLREPRRFDALVEVAVGADALAEGDVEVKSGHGYQN